MKKAWVMVAVTALLVAGLLAGCNQTPSSADPEGAVLKVNASTEPPSLDPPEGFDSVSYDILNNIMEGLVRLDKHHQPQPAMAEKWEISADKKTYIFHLRDSKWSNGEAVTAEDFEYAWKRMVDPKNAFPSSFLAFYIEGAEEYNAGKGQKGDIKVEAVDEKTLRVRLKEPTGFFLKLIATPAFFPVHKKTVEKDPKRWESDASTILSNGPFKLTEWKHDSELKAVKHGGYWDQESVKLGGIHWSMVNDENTEYQMFQSGELDAVENVPTELKQELIQSGKAKTDPVASIYYYRMHTEMEPFHNKKIRKAFSLAINRQEIIDHVVQGGQKPAMAHVPYGMKQPDGKEFREDGGSFFKDHDVKKAKQLLKEGMKEEGYEKLPPITMTYNTDDTHKVVAEALQEMLRKNLDVKVKLQNKEWKVFLAEQRAGKLQFSRSTIPADYADPLNYLELFQTGHPGNRVAYSNKEYDHLVAKIRNTEDEKERFKLMHEAEAMFMDDMPILPIFFGTRVYMQNPDVTGIVRHPVGNIEFKWVRKKGD
ncbi:dipeptide transport system substrate-binding protein [Melghirimyces profundicolus]|uniref:Dipeptide transport system substrate-binding protein n=1 Tax=Melghirimyces profundicolus TaxID=1242148 RepID=A0A2T6BV89_9BACL|nr:peptide ABC transporter substrate-binding protein [Melghirimyces profundicolus]PTX59990.1 dipeptide transport system substrate-binding protein [Melghirimyces profundicolus]